MTRILDIEGCEYNGVWRAWKVGSLGLFAIFVALLADVAATLRRIEQTRSAEVDEGFIGILDEYGTIWDGEPGASKRIGDAVDRPNEETFELILHDGDGQCS